MEIYIVWLIAALVLLIVEIFTVSFGVVCFSLGAVFAALGAYLGLSVLWQLLIFSVVSFVAFVFIRPFVVKFLLKKKKPDMVCFYTSLETVLTISSTADALKSRRCSLCQSLLLTFCRLTLLCVIFPGQKFYCKVFPNPKPWLTEAGTEK